MQAFLRTDRELYSASHGPVGTNFAEGSGTTALTALIWGDQLIVANAGDCRAVLCRRGKAIDLTNDHRPCNPEEALRVKAAGGHICADGYLNGHLAVLRALGDHHFKDLKAPTGPDGAMEGPLLAEPEVALHTISPEDEFILMACDGLWDVFKSQRAVEFARQKLRDHNDPQLCSQQLVSFGATTDSLGYAWIQSVSLVFLPGSLPPSMACAGLCCEMLWLSEACINTAHNHLLLPLSSRMSIDSLLQIYRFKAISYCFRFVSLDLYVCLLI